MVGAIPIWSEPQLHGGRLFWLERRPEDGGRTRLLMRPAEPVGVRAGERPASEPPSGREITPAGADVRSRIHAYGGGAYAVGASPGQASPAEHSEARSAGNAAAGTAPGRAGSSAGGTVVVWVDDGDRCLWRLDLPALEADASADLHPGPADLQTAVGTSPLRLTQPDQERRFADGLIDSARDRWIGVLETGEQEALVSVPLAGGEPLLLHQPADFCGYAVLSPSGTHLAWVEWQRPAMPWERSQLWLGRFTPEGFLANCRPIAGSVAREGAAVSVFQPLWIPREGRPADLVVSADRSGWWNLERLDAAEALAAGEEPAWQPLLPLQAEFGMPQWVYGMATTAWDGEALVAAACFEGRWRLGRLMAAEGAEEAGATAGANAAIAGTVGGTGVETTAGQEAHRSAWAQAEAAATENAATNARKNASSPAGVTGRAEAVPPGNREIVSPTDQEIVASRGQDTISRRGREIAPPGAPQAVVTSRQTSVAATDLESGQRGDQPGAWGRGAWRWHPYDLRFDDLAAVAAERGRLVALAASPTDPAGLLELDTTSGRWRHTPSAASPLTLASISRPEPLGFEGHAGLATHAWYYPPRGGGQPGSPLLVKGHSGPTGMARTGLNLAIQFWTSRGWGVVDVNYGGSTGFGRAYRERLDGQWGVADAADCAAAAAALIAAGRADPRRIAIEGGSAAGFTVLAALCGGAVFRAGACRYAVADLEGMVRHTHRFEARYLDGLVGPWPEAAATYRERSPLLHADRIAVPVIFFQGLEDAVVPPDQTERMALALGERGIPVEVHLFPGEGHGFRDRAVQQRVLEATEAFFRRHLELP